MLTNSFPVHLLSQLYHWKTTNVSPTRIIDCDIKYCSSTLNLQLGALVPVTSRSTSVKHINDFCHVMDIFFFSNAYTLKVSHCFTVGWPQFHWKHVHDKEILYKYFSVSKNSIKKSFWIIVITLFSIQIFLISIKFRWF